MSAELNISAGVTLTLTLQTRAQYQVCIKEEIAEGDQLAVAVHFYGALRPAGNKKPHIHILFSFSSISKPTALHCEGQNK